jgi:hypothetical protein
MVRDRTSPLPIRPVALIRLAATLVPLAALEETMLAGVMGLEAIVLVALATASKSRAMPVDNKEQLDADEVFIITKVD